MEYSVLRWTNRISSRLKHLLEQVLSYHYVLLLRLGGYRYYAYKGGTSSFYQFWANQEDQLHDPVSTTIMTRHRLFYNVAILVMINRQVLHLQAGWISVEYFKDQHFGQVRALKADSSGLFLTIFLWETNVSRLSMKLACWPGFSRRRKWQGLKDDQMLVYKNP